MHNKKQNASKNNLKKILLIVIVILFVCLAIYAFTPCIIEQRKLNKQIANLENEIERVRESNKKLAKEIFALKNDPLYIEKLARKELGLIRSGEVIYKLKPDKE
ncbi:MAG: septum formation initiator family protein [bacterium]|nr:septum formation initiator family protein [bacterium]